MFTRWIDKLRGRPTLKVADSEGWVAVDDQAQARAHMAAHPCACMGRWTIAEAITSREDGERRYFDQVGTCRDCGSQATFKFSAPLRATPALAANDDDDDDVLSALLDDAQELRPQHYVFCHQVLNREYFENHQGLMNLLAVGGQVRLRALWKQVESQVLSPGDQTINAADLRMREQAFLGRPGYLIELPAARYSPEAHFIALISGGDDGQEPRYFLLENTAPDIGILCEWLAGQKRRNHSLQMAPDVDAFVEAVEKQLRDENQRQQQGGVPVVARTRDPAGHDDPMDAMLEHSGYRLHICAFAFHIIPTLMEGILDALSRQDPDHARVLLADSWQRDLPSPDSDAQVNAPAPALDLVEVAGKPAALIRMPAARAVPEPVWMLISPAACGRMLLLELSGTSEAMGMLATQDAEGNHGIVGGLNDLTERGFLEAAGRFFSGEPMQRVSDVMGHLLLYARIHSEWQAALGEAD